jgi:hypothetical protein
MPVLVKQIGITPPPVRTITPPTPAPEQKLSVEILGGFIGTRFETMPRPYTYFLLNVRLINRRDPPVMVKQWEVSFKSCSNGIPQGCGYVIPIPEGFSCSPEEDWPGTGKRTIIDHGIGLDQKAKTVSVAFGAQSEGYLLIRTQDYYTDRYFGLDIELKVTDTLDNVSTCVEAPDKWLTKRAEMKWP